MKNLELYPALKAGLSIAALALMAGMAQAQDPGPGADGTITDVPVDEVIVTDPPESVDDGIIDSGIVEDPGIGDDGGSVYLDGVEIGVVDPTVDGGGIDDGVFEEPVFGDGGETVVDPIDGGEVLPIGELDLDVTIYMLDGGADFPESTCGGCEYQTMSGGPEVQLDMASPSKTNAGSGSAATADMVTSNRNICFEADLYIPLLCDWQRPFFGDRMP